MKNKVIIILIAFIIGAGIGFYVGFKDDNTTTSKEAETGKAKLFNQRALAYGEKLKVNKDGYKVLDIIDNEDDYEEFLSDYEFAYQAKSSIKEYDKKYKYIMLGLYPDYCVDTINPKKYKLVDDKLTLYVDVDSVCGLCAREQQLYEIAVDKDLEFDNVKVVLNDTTECPTDVIY